MYVEKKYIVDEFTMSKLFRKRFNEGLKKFNEIYKANYNIITEYISYIQNEEKLDRPTSNSLFKGLESEYSSQVIKW